MYIHVYCFIVYIDICLELEIVHLKLRPLKLVGSLINHHQFKILANKLSLWWWNTSLFLSVTKPRGYQLGD